MKYHFITICILLSVGCTAFGQIAGFKISNESDVYKTYIAIGSGEKPILTAVDAQGNPVTIEEVTSDPALTVKDGKIVVGELSRNTTTVNVKAGTLVVPLTLELFTPKSPEYGDFNIESSDKKLKLAEKAALWESSQFTLSTNVSVPAGMQETRYKIVLTGSHFVKDGVSKTTLERSNWKDAKLVADGAGPVTVTFSSIGLTSPKSITSTLSIAHAITVTLASKASSISFKNGETKPVALVITPNVSDDQVSLDATPAGSVSITKNGQVFTVTALKTTTDGKLKVSIVGLEQTLIPFSIDPSASSVTLSQESFLEGQSTDVTYSFKSKDGGDFTPTSNPTITVNPASSASVVTTSPGKLKIVPNQEGTTTLTFVSNGDTLSTSIIITKISSEAVLKADLQPIDYRTSRQLFGEKFSDQFYVVLAHLANSLSGANVGRSILVYSTTFEAGIDLEAKEDGTRTGMKGGKWMPVRPEELETEYFRARENDLNRVPSNSRSRTLGLPSTTSISAGPGAVLALRPGEFIQLTLKDDAGRQIQDVTWAQPDSSKDKFTLSENGVVYALSVTSNPDLVLVTATYKLEGGTPKTAQVAVHITMNGSTPVTPDEAGAVVLALDEGSFGILKYTAGDSYKCNDTSVATVASDGTISSFKAGTALITVVRGTKELHVIVRVFKRDYSYPPGVYLDGGVVKRVRTRLRYRPYSYDLVLSAQDAMGAETSRALALRSLDFAIGIGNGIMGVAKLNNWQSKEISLTSSILVPLLDKLWPDHTATQRGNVQNYFMKPLEEIPYGGEITKLLVFPRQEIPGVLARKLVRISAVDTQVFNVRVGVVIKVDNAGNGTNATANQSGATPPAGGGQ